MNNNKDCRVGQLTRHCQEQLKHLEVKEKKSWKLLEPVLAGLLLVVDPHLLKYINTCTNISNSCVYILMLLN